MMSEKKLYVPQEDFYYANPYVDVEEWRTVPIRHLYVHGGFRGTEKEGQEARFCFYFPERKMYEGRFYHYVTPAPEDENNSEYQSGEDDKIAFALTHGAYYVMSNQGGWIMQDVERLYKTSANVAEFGRVTARRIYGYEHRPFGYIFGGSGGSFKTISCMEMTEGIWDGAVPFVIGNPMATPNAFCPRVRAMRVLGEEGMRQVVDNLEPGGSGDLYYGLNEEQRQALEEATRMGFPRRAWFCYPFMGDGALMVLAPTIYKVYPKYFEDFWMVEGYAGADPDSGESKARLQFVTTVKELIPREKEKGEKHFGSVDNSWHYTLIGNREAPLIRMDEMPPKDSYLYHSRIRVLSGAAKGKECAIDCIDKDLISVSRANESVNAYNALEGLAVGDQIMIDNSDYLAMQTLNRHQVPSGKEFPVYDIYINEDGTLKYPQLPELIAPIIAESGGGSLMNGDIHGKVIAVCSLLDEAALPWFGDWYRHAVERHKGEETDACFRLYFNDNCIHFDLTEDMEDPQHAVDYSGILHQALLDVAAWCEKGVEPLPGTTYKVSAGQIEIPDAAQERHGLQPVVKAFANGEKCTCVKVGETVKFSADIEAPRGSGKITFAAWDFERTNDFSHGEKLELSQNGERAFVHATHVFTKPGTYFPVIKVKSNRKGELSDYFTQCKNLDRVRVIVS